MAATIEFLWSLIRQLQGTEAIAAVNLASPGVGNVAFTTLDCSASVPKLARFAVLSVTLGGTVPGAAFVSNRVDFRKDSNSQVFASVGAAYAAAGGQITAQAIVPLTIARTFQYSKTDAIGASSGATINLVGWIG